MDDKNRAQFRSVETKEATEKVVPSPGATNIGTSGLTSVPGSVPNDAPVPLETRKTGTQDESMRDDVAMQSTRARFKMPSSFTILWQNKKARVGVVMLLLFVLI